MNGRVRPECLRCSLPMVPGTVTSPPEGKVAHRSRNLCRGCFYRVEREGDLDRYPLVYRRAEVVAEDVDHLIKQGMKREAICREMGMQWDSIMVAIRRAKERERTSA